MPCDGTHPGAATCTWATVCSCVLHRHVDAGADVQGDRAWPVRGLTRRLRASSALHKAIERVIVWFEDADTAQIDLPRLESHGLRQNRRAHDLKPTSSQRSSLASS